MYITVMDYSTKTVTTLAWDRESAEIEEIECLLEGMGYHLSQIHYMTSDEEPAIGSVEVSDLISENSIRRLRS